MRYGDAKGELGVPARAEQAAYVHAHYPSSVSPGAVTSMDMV
jgi:hypothetical protein